MAYYFKQIAEDSKSYSRTFLYEQIVITGSVVSGSKDNPPFSSYTSTLWDGTSVTRMENIKTHPHGRWQSVYDYPYASASSNHLFDITIGISPYVPPGTNEHGFQGLYSEKFQIYNESVSGSGTEIANKKRDVYNHMAQNLVGYDTQGNIRLFDKNEHFSPSEANPDGLKILDPIFFNFSRAVIKDGIKKGTFNMGLGVHTSLSTPFARMISITDAGVFSESSAIKDPKTPYGYKTNSPAGEYAILTVSNLRGAPLSTTAIAASGSAVGFIYYQAGIVVLDASKIFRSTPNPNGTATGEFRDNDGLLDLSGIGNSFVNFSSSNSVANHALSFPGRIMNSGSINLYCDNIRNRLSHFKFESMIEKNAAIYFCRANHNEFNYSSNHSYLNKSKVRVKGDDPYELPRSYITTVGLYSEDNELLAVGKLSEPLRKDPLKEVTIRVKVDF